MCRRTISMFRARIGMSSFAMFDGFREVFYPFGHMWVLPRRLRMLERFTRMLNARIGMPFLSMRRGTLRMFGRFSGMFVARKRHPTQHRHADKRSYRSHYQRTSTRLGHHHCLLHG
jgi:hypothetical protein